jgi:hypothetical protein
MALDLDLDSASRVELEPVLAACVRRGTPESLADAAAIRAELASRVWQNHNPYAPVVELAALGRNVP